MIFKTVTLITVVSLFTAMLSAALFAALFSAPPRQNVFACFLTVFFLCEGILLLAVFERRAPVFGKIFHEGATGSGAVAITFDDGPNEPYTSQILDILRRYGVRATFFVIGNNCLKFPDALKRIAAGGHEIGNHTWTHEVLPLKPPSSIEEEIRKTSDIVEKFAGKRPTLFRAPHGWRNPWADRAARKAGCTPVAWTLGVWDTDRPGTETIIARTLKGAREGCVLLVHDGRGTEDGADSSQLVDALPVIIEELKRRGLRFVTVSEMMKSGAR